MSRTFDLDDVRQQSVLVEFSSLVASLFFRNQLFGSHIAPFITCQHCINKELLFLEVFSSDLDIEGSIPQCMQIIKLQPSCSYLMEARQT